MPKKPRWQQRSERAEALAREIRYQIAHTGGVALTQTNLDAIWAYLDAWMHVATKNKYERPKIPRHQAKYLAKRDKVAKTPAP